MSGSFSRLEPVGGDRESLRRRKTSRITLSTEACGSGESSHANGVLIRRARSVSPAQQCCQRFFVLLQVSLRHHPCPSRKSRPANRHLHLRVIFSTVGLTEKVTGSAAKTSQTRFWRRTATGLVGFWSTFAESPFWTALGSNSRGKKPGVCLRCCTGSALLGLALDHHLHKASYSLSTHRTAFLKISPHSTFRIKK